MTIIDILLMILAFFAGVWIRGAFDNMIKEIQ